MVSNLTLENQALYDFLIHYEGKFVLAYLAYMGLILRSACFPSNPRKKSSTTLLEGSCWETPNHLAHRRRDSQRQRLSAVGTQEAPWGFEFLGNFGTDVPNTNEIIGMAIRLT